MPTLGNKKRPEPCWLRGRFRGSTSSRQLLTETDLGEFINKLRAVTGGPGPSYLVSEGQLTDVIQVF